MLSCGIGWKTATSEAEMAQDISLNTVKDSNEAASALSAWWREQSPAPKTVAVFGKGRDYQLFCEAVPAFSQDILALIDDSGAPGTVSLNECLRLQPKLIITASLPHQETMRRRLRSAGYDGDIILPYKNDPEIGALGLFAYNPALDWPAPGPERPTKRCQPKKINRILLYAPPFAKANARHKKTMPMGLLYIAAAIRKNFPGISLEIYDGHLARHSWEEAKAYLDSRSFDMLLCSYWSAQAASAYLVSEHVMRTRDAVVVHGGVHPTLCAHEAVGYCHRLICGEGERQIAELIRQLNSGAAPEDFKPDPALIENLDELEFPAWDLLPNPSAYDHPMHVVGGWRFPIMGSRGCPFKCSFCSSPLIWKERVRWRSPQNIVDEMDEIKHRFGVERFHFWDDNFLLKRQHTEEFCRELLRRKRRYLWCGLSRASDILKNSEILPLLKETGCVGIEIGVESFSDQVSKAVGKGEFANETSLAAESLTAAQLAPLYTHMLFVPGETIDSYAEKESFMKRLSSGLPNSLKSDSELGQLTTPHLCTRFAAEAPSLGKVLWRTASDSFHHRVNFIPTSLLDDIAVPLKDAKMPDPLTWLARVSQAIFDWNEDDMRAFVRLAPPLWSSMDGNKSIRQIAEELSTKISAPMERTLPMTCLHIVNWSRQSLIRSKGKD